MSKLDRRHHEVRLHAYDGIDGTHAWIVALPNDPMIGTVVTTADGFVAHPVDHEIQAEPGSPWRPFTSPEIAARALAARYLGMGAY